MVEAGPPPSCTFQSARLLPEIRIDTSRLDGLLAGFQKRLTALETSFAKVAESAAEAAQKVVTTSSPKNTAPPSPMRSITSSRGAPTSPSTTASELFATVVLPPLDTGPQTPAENGSVYPNKAKSDPPTGQDSSEVIPDDPGTNQEPPTAEQRQPMSTSTDNLENVETRRKGKDPDALEATQNIGRLKGQGSKTDTTMVQAMADASPESLRNEIQPQVDALWDAVKWMEDQMDAIDACRKEELEDASRTVAQNTAKAEVAKMERERIKLALEDRPVRSELEALNELHGDRVRMAEGELRRLVAELSSRLQEELHAKIDKLYEDTSGWKKRLDKTTMRLDQRVHHLEEGLDEEIRSELGECDLPSDESLTSEDEGELDNSSSPGPSDPPCPKLVITTTKTITTTPRSARRTPRSARRTPRSARRTPRSARQPLASGRRRSVLMQQVRTKRESGFQQKINDAVSTAKNGDAEILAGIDNLRTEFAGLVLRVEEGELQKDQFVREIDGKVCEGGQEVEVSLSRMKDFLLEEIASTQMYVQKVEMQQEEAVKFDMLNEVLRGSDTVRDVVAKAFSLEEGISALSASLKAAEKKLVQIDETNSRSISEVERRMSSRVQTLTNTQTGAHEELEKQIVKLKETKADEDSLQETRDNLMQRMRTLEYVTNARKKEVMEHLKSKVDTILSRLLEVENVAEAVRADLTPEIAAVEREVERAYTSLKRALGGHQDVLDAQDRKVTAISGEVTDSCSSLRSDVRDMLVCLMPNNRKTELERPDDPEYAPSLAEVANIIQEEDQRREESTKRVERANVGLTVLVKKLERSLLVLSSKDLFWEEIGNKLNAHAEAFADASWRVEAISAEQDRFVLATDLQHYIAGNTQRVAKLIGQKADFEIILRLTASSNIEKEGYDLDRRLQTLRGVFLENFVSGARRYVDKKYPAQGSLQARNRSRFFLKMDQALKVAMSKYRSVDVGNTLFGKVKLDPSCIACDRPFGPAAQAILGDARAAPLEPLPTAQAVKDAMAGRPRTPATTMDGIRTPDPFVDSAVAGGFRGGRNSKSTSKFVYRGGFKIPKDITPIPSVESLVGEIGGSTGSLNVSSNALYEQDAGNVRDNSTFGGASGSTLRDQGRHRREGGGDLGSQLGLEGIISSSRMRVGNGSERLGIDGGERRGSGRVKEAIKMPRPKTASATIGRGDSTFSADSTPVGFRSSGVVEEWSCS